MRPTCYRCLKPQTVCLCDRIPRIANRTEVVILQHPKERTHSLGTARIARLGLARAKVHVIHTSWGLPLEHPLSFGPETALLYPHPDAVDLGSLAPAARPERLVVLDGTWSHARKLYRENPWLHRLQHVSLTPTSPSRYRIRREPKPEYISTIEAIVAALSLLEPETAGLHGLLTAFEALVDDQIEMRTQAADTPRRLRERQRPYRAIPHRLLGPDGNLVVVYGEFQPQTRLRGDAGPSLRELLQWTAVRLGDGTRFERFVRAMPSATDPAPSPSDCYLAHLGLTREDLAGAVSPARFLSDWNDFLRPGDVLAAWKRSSLDLLQAAGDGRGGEVLKTAYTNVRNRSCGTLDATLVREGIPTADWPEGTFRGRADRRLANARAILEWLRATGARRIAHAGDCAAAR